MLHKSTMRQSYRLRCNGRKGQRVWRSTTTRSSTTGRLLAHLHLWYKTWRKRGPWNIGLGELRVYIRRYPLHFPWREANPSKNAASPCAEQSSSQSSSVADSYTGWCDDRRLNCGVSYSVWDTSENAFHPGLLCSISKQCFVIRWGLWAGIITACGSVCDQREPESKHSVLCLFSCAITKRNIDGLDCNSWSLIIF